MLVSETYLHSITFDCTEKVFDSCLALFLECYVTICNNNHSDICDNVGIINGICSCNTVSSRELLVVQLFLLCVVDDDATKVGVLLHPSGA